MHRESESLAAQVASKKIIIPNYKLFTYNKKNNHYKKITPHQLLISKNSVVDNYDIKFAYVSPQDYSAINIELTNEGGKKLKEFTKSFTKNVDRLATVFNGEVVNYATLNAEYLGKRFVITGLDSKQEAEKIISSIRSPLTSTLKIIEERQY